MNLRYIKFAGPAAGAMRMLSRGLFLSTLLILIWQPAYSQPPARPIILRDLDVIVRDARIDLPVRDLRRQFVNQPFSSPLRAAIREQIMTQMKEQGYYFAQVDSQDVTVDSIRYMAHFTLVILPGGRLTLHAATPVYADSIPPEIREEISGVCRDFSGRTYTAELASGLYGEIVQVLENNGYPLARLETGTFSMDAADDGNWELDLGVRVAPGDSVRLAYLRFPGAKTEMKTYLQRVLRYRRGQAYRQKRIDRYISILERQEFLKQVERPVLGQDTTGRYYLSIAVSEAPSTAFDGVVGYVPPPAADPEASGYFTGLLNIGIRNLFGGGRKAQIFWQKQDEFSDEFRLSYREPYVLGLPFHAGGSMYRLVRDTTFIEWQYELNTEVPISENISGFANFATRSVVPDSLASRQLRLPRTSGFSTETGIRWDRRDVPLNPRRGIAFEAAFSISRQKIEGPAYLILEDSLNARETLRHVRIDISGFLPTFGNQVLANHLHLEFVENSSGPLRSPDQIWFGGASTIRGYREAQFFARRVGWLNTEYRFLLGRDTRFFLFTDNGYFTRQFPQPLEKWLTSYGVGLRFPGPLGIIQFDYGLEKGTSFREGKIHFRIVNEF